MSLVTAMKLFRTIVLLTLTYGLEEIWEYLTRRQLQELESLKPRYLKRVLAVSKFALSGYVYFLAREIFLIEDLRTQMLLQHTDIRGTATKATGEKGLDRGKFLHYRCNGQQGMDARRMS